MHTEDPVLALMDRFAAALNSHDLEAVLALVTDDVVFASTSPPPDGVRYQGQDAKRMHEHELQPELQPPRLLVSLNIVDHGARNARETPTDGDRQRDIWLEGAGRGLAADVGPGVPLAPSSPGVGGWFTWIASQVHAGSM